nr:MAG TPA: hypothetical protein [Caudoviricetes sp.]
MRSSNLAVFLCCKSSLSFKICWFLLIHESLLSSPLNLTIVPVLACLLVCLFSCYLRRIGRDPAISRRIAILFSCLVYL